MTRPRSALALLVMASCATLGDAGHGDAGLPTAGAGPFRALTAEEVRGLAPYVLDDAVAGYHDPAVLPDGASTLLYAVARVGGEDVIVRTRANDERTFFGSGLQFGVAPAVVLRPELPWERSLSGPALVRFRGELLLYYAGDEGIGMARSEDGVRFEKVPAPVLARASSAEAAAAWETTAPRAPSVFVAADGRTLRLLYSAGDAIGEASSDDGVAWRRLGPEPAIAPARVTTAREEPPFDAVAVSDPCAVTRVTPAGRFHVRVLYTGMDVSGATAIGFAARYGDDGRFDRQPVPAYSVGLHERAPALLDRGAVSYLYVAQDRPDGTRPPFAAIAAAVAPATGVLPPTADAPDTP